MPNLLLVAVFLAGCADVHVSAPDGRDRAGSARVLDPGCLGSPYASIQDAIDDAASGDVVEVCAGIWLERLTVGGKALTLVARDGAALTTIDAEGLGPALVVTSGADLVVEGFTFVNGYGGSGLGGNVACDDAALVLRGSVLRDGGAEKGGGLGADGCDGLAEGNTFEGNHAAKGGGGYVDGTDGVFDLVGNTVIRNIADVQGGGLYVFEGAPRVDGNTFEENEAAADAGGLRIKIADPTVTGNVFLRNHSGAYGGAMKISHDEAVLAGNVYVENTAAIGGGALWLFESASLVTGEVFEANTALNGGAVMIVEGWGGPVFEDCTFDGNVGTLGGHVFVELADYTSAFRRVDFRDGRASQGGAIHAVGSLLQIENVLFERNRATVRGGALSLDGTAGTVVNAVATSNRAPDGAVISIANGVGFSVTNTVFSQNRVGAAVAVSSGLAPTLRYDDFWQNTSDVAGMDPVLDVDGNFAVVPGFVDPALGDYTLHPASALVDAGDPALLDLDGTRSDIGLHGGLSAP